MPDFFCKIHKSYVISLKHLNVVERHQVDRDVIAVVGRLDRMDRETRICRGIK